MPVQYLQNVPFRNLVDMGCGTGQLLIELAHRKPNAHFIGIDRDEQVLDEARNQIQGTAIASRITVLAEDCVKTSLLACSADVVVFRSLLHHIEDVAAAFREANRILCHGGCLLIRDGKRMSETLFEEMNEQLRSLGLPPEVHPGFDIGNLTKHLSTHDFRVEQVIAVGEATFATPPYTTKVYATDTFLLSARKSKDTIHAQVHLYCRHYSSSRQL